MAKKIELNDKEKLLLHISASELIPMLSENSELGHVKQNAFTYYDKKSKTTYQVQVTVTRNKSDFLEDFQTEEMCVYGD